MAFQIPEINEIKPDIENVTIYIRSMRKWGKSTLFRDIVLEKYGDPSYGLSVLCGAEKGETMLDGLNKVRIKTYTDAIDLKTYLIDKVYIQRAEKDMEVKGKKVKKGQIISKTPIEHNIKIVSFDVVDELFPMFEKETIRISNIENPAKKVKSINAAMNGRHAGQFYTADLVKAYMNELIEAGFGIFAIAHSKMKTIKEKGSTDEDGYNQLSSSLMSTYDTVFADIFDLVITGVIDREYEEKSSTDANGKEIIKRYQTSEMRKLYFRGTSLIDAGSRFADGAVPEYMIWDKENMAADFIKVVEEGMKKSKTNWNKKGKSKSKVKLPEPVEEVEVKDVDVYLDIDEDEVSNTGDEDILEDDNYPENLLDEVTSLYKSLEDKTLKKEIVAIVKQFGKFKEVPEDTLREIYDMLIEK